MLFADALSKIQGRWKLVFGSNGPPFMLYIPVRVSGGTAAAQLPGTPAHLHFAACRRCTPKDVIAMPQVNEVTDIDVATGTIDLASDIGPLLFQCVFQPCALIWGHEQ